MTFALAANLSEAEPAERFLLQSIPLAVALVVALLLGGEMLRNTWAAVRAGRLSIETLFIVAMLGAFGASFGSYFSGRGPVFFEVASILLVVYAFGRQLARYTQSRVLSALTQWDPAALKCEILKGEAWGSRTAADIRRGDHVRVHPGVMIPVDGLVLQGEALVQEVGMTGELLAVRREEGQAVLAGTHVVDATLVIKATVDGFDRCLDRITSALREAAQRPGESQILADRLARWFVPSVLLAAMLTFAVHNAVAGWGPALFDAMAVLLVACPCALGFATPLAVWTGMRRLQSLGLYVKRGDAIERLAAVDCAVFDKTGTLSLPELSTQLRIESKWRERRADLEDLIGAAEAPIHHPVARVLAQLAVGRDRYRAHSVRIEPGRGISAHVGTTAESARTIRIVSTPATADTASLSVEIDGERAATIALREMQRPHASAISEALQTIGIDSVLMTGDRWERTSQFAFPNTYAGLKPEQKLEHVRSWNKKGRRILFVGDGMNDAAAMAVSDVAIVVGAEPGLVQEVASIVWPDPHFDRLPKAIAVCRDTVRIVRLNLRFALIYNLLGMAIAACGLLHPVVAALLMAISSCVVTLRSLRLLDADRSPASNDAQ